MSPERALNLLCHGKARQRNLHLSASEVCLTMGMFGQVGVKWKNTEFILEVYLSFRTHSHRYLALCQSFFFLLLVWCMWTTHSKWVYTGCIDSLTQFSQVRRGGCLDPDIQALPLGLCTYFCVPVMGCSPAVKREEKKRYIYWKLTSTFQVFMLCIVLILNKTILT